ncbi:hypothetical protein E4T50_09103 [Aureobasidium sp. EXF-12298]|nr:hypothetical protein E4T50_09103 [Aureobasidium sp. EXF-12298]KAI4758062.1 hypothetical protein E4T51_08887 [Aureobasidium sp. EXF-12344]
MLGLPSGKYLSTRFSCVYGISTPLFGINKGDCFSVYRKNSLILIFTGKGSVIFYFVFQDRGQTFPFESTPQDALEDVESACQNMASLRFSKTISFGDIYARRTVTKRTALKEGLADNWHHGRMVIVRDAAYKKAVQDKGHGRWTNDCLTDAFARYTETREPRAQMAFEKVAMACRE